MSKHKKYKKSIRNAKWRANKRDLLAHGWKEPFMNILVPNTPSYPEEYTPKPGWIPMKTIPCAGCTSRRH